MCAISSILLEMIDSLRPLHPRFDDWNWGDGPEIDETEALGGIYPFANIRPDIERAIERNVTIVDGDPEPLEGYFMMLKTDLTKPERLVHLSVSAGCGDLCISVSPFCNSAEFEIDPTPDLSLLTFSVWRRVMLILAETWEATWAEASPMDIRSEWTGFPVRRAWMNYVSPRLAPLITPPPGVIVERRPNGGLFLAATDETFQTANPKHKAAARTIEAALQPLNTIPYPIDDPYK